jgi:serine/threonine-protein kinase
VGAVTEVGAVLGTAGYTSPEQARGRPVDKRTDIWAFGCVLYEMLTGQPAFGSEDPQTTLARVLERDVNLGALPAAVSPAVRQTLKLCLQKDARNRARDIGDVRLALTGAFDSGTGTKVHSARGAWLVAGAAIVLAAVGFWVSSPEPPHAGPLMRFGTDLGIGGVLGPTTAISPDGTRIVYRASGSGGVAQLATRLLNDKKDTLLAGTEGAYNPFFSPDGRSIAYFVAGRLMKTTVEGGVPIALADAAIGRIGSWSEDGFIYAELNPFSGIFRIPADGGTPELLTRPRQYRHTWPQALPGRRLLYTAGLAGLLENGQIEILSLDTGETKTVLKGGYMARYVSSGPTSGHILYVHQGVLYAVPFDLDTLEVVGERVQVADDVASTGALLANALAVSSTGTLIYTSGRVAQRWPIAWIDGSGSTEPLLEMPGGYYTPRISPDGGRLAYALEGERGQDIHVYDIDRGIATRLTFTSAANLWPVWAPDGEHLAFTSLSEDRAALWWMRTDGTGEPLLLLERENPIRQIMLSADGTVLAFTEQDEDTGSDLWILPLDLTDPDAPKPQEPTPLVKTAFNEGVPDFSPDGRWIAYLSDELGPYQVWVQPFPGLEGRWQISSGAGGYPFWSSTENVLFYASGGGQIWRAEYSTEGARFVPGATGLWLNAPMVPATTGFEALDLAPDGRRFAVFLDASESASATGQVTVLLNFFADLQRRAPEAR